MWSTSAPNPTRSLSCSLALTTLLGACAAGPDFVRPQPPTATHYDPNTEPAQVELVDSAPQDWWRSFQSDAVDHLVDEALHHNPSVAVTEATLRESEAERRAGAGIFYPSVALGAGAQRQLSTPQKLGLGGTGSIFNLYTLGATVAYNVDLFGANRRTVEVLGAGVDEARYRRDTARLALAGNVVGTVVAHAAYEEQITITERMAADEQQQLALVTAQVDAGVLAESAALATRNQLDITRAALPLLKAKEAASRHLLATLIGQAPAEANSEWPCWADLHLPTHLPLTLPSTLVRQRPDILAAEAALHGATANIGVAAANLFPSVTLGATGGWVSSKANKLGAANGRYWSVGPSIEFPLFAGGADLARRDSAIAARDAALANYRQTILAVFDQVADVLSDVQYNTEAAAARTDALHANEQNLALSEATHAAGTLSEYDYLTTRIALDGARLAAIDADAQRLQDAVALYAALGGGWDDKSQEAAQ
ncbi:MAG: efflux transporter outer membrane subunit [Burkholderiales bacterium]|nr:efflux transporter outer membrane subunit [Burkholderiales bacterium]